MKTAKGKATRGKRPGLRARSKNARTVREAAMRHRPLKAAPQSVRITMSEREELYFLRTQVPAMIADVFDMRGKLAMCRQIMEANDPGNAYLIFGPPLDLPQSGSPDAEGGIPDTAPENLEETSDRDRAEDVYA